VKIVVLGGPGAGKGTQLMRIAGKLNMVHISTGDIFRENISRQTELGKLANTYISKGKLVPDTVTCNMVAERISKEDCKDGYALDGFPRTIEQAEYLDNYLKNIKEELDAVIDIEVDDSLIIERLTGRRICPDCGMSFHIEYKIPQSKNKCDSCEAVLIHRDDDKYETIKNRLDVYHRQTTPLKNYYKESGKLFTIDGNGSVDEIESEILKALGAMND